MRWPRWTRGATDPTTVFNTAAKSFLNAVGASSGPLYATAFMRAGAAVKGKATLDDADVVAMMPGHGQGHRRSRQGGARREDHDRCLAAGGRGRRRSARKGMPSPSAEAAAARRNGAEATKSMIATKGRSARLGERSLGHIDPGAASAVIVIEAMARSLKG